MIKKNPLREEFSRIRLLGLFVVDLGEAINVSQRRTDVIDELYGQSVTSTS